MHKDNMMEYDKIKNQMEQYFKDYSQFAQDEDTMPKMDKYWSDDIKITAYFQIPGGDYPLKMSGRRVWQDFLIKGHLTIWEDLRPVEIMIDPVKLHMTARLKVIKFDRETNKQLCDLDSIGYYKLRKKDDGSFEMTQLDFYTGNASVFGSLYTLE